MNPNLHQIHISNLLNVKTVFRLYNGLPLKMNESVVYIAIYDE
jgi:hypothetical protein